MDSIHLRTNQNVNKSNPTDKVDTSKHYPLNSYVIYIQQRKTENVKASNHTSLSIKKKLRVAVSLRSVILDTACTAMLRTPSPALKAHIKFQVKVEATSNKFWKRAKM